MKRAAGCLAFAASFWAALGSARAEALRVAVERSPSHDAATERLVAELESEGYALSWLEPGAGSSPCSGTAPATPLPAAFIRLEQEPEAALVVAVICYARRERAFEQTSVSAAVGEHERLALAVVEALNGLKAEPLNPVESPGAAQTPPMRRTEANGSNTVFGNAAVAFDVVGGLPLVGAGFGLDAHLYRRLSLELETFVPVRESNSRGLERELSLAASWARFGPRLTWLAPPLRFGFSLQAGPALVWARARSKTPERVGTTAATAAALLSSGLSLECPSSTSFYLRASGHVSRLLPSIELSRGDGSSAIFGQLLLDLRVGIGVRWGTGG